MGDECKGVDLSPVRRPWSSEPGGRALRGAPSAAAAPCWFGLWAAGANSSHIRTRTHQEVPTRLPREMNSAYCKLHEEPCRFDPELNQRDQICLQSWALVLHWVTQIIIWIFWSFQCEFRWEHAGYWRVFKIFSCSFHCFLFLMNSYRRWAEVLTSLPPKPPDFFNKKTIRTRRFKMI